MTVHLATLADVTALRNLASSVRSDLDADWPGEDNAYPLQRLRDYVSSGRAIVLVDIVGGGLAGASIWIRRSGAWWMRLFITDPAISALQRGRSMQRMFRFAAEHVPPDTKLCGIGRAGSGAEAYLAARLPSGDNRQVRDGYVLYSGTAADLLAAVT